MRFSIHVSALRPLLAVALGALALPAARAAAEAATTNLGPMVARLSEKNQPAARDWSEFANETIRWGQRLQASQEPVPVGPVHDALAATDLGEKLDPKVTDWPKLRSDLQSLLEKPEQQRQQQKKSDQQKDDQSKQDQEQQKQPPKNQSQKPESDEDRSSPNQQQQKKNDENQSSSDQSSQKKSPPDQSSQPDSPKPDDKKDGGKQGQSAFGDMQQPPTPPPSPDPHPGDTQTVGGARENKEDAKAPSDPALAIPLQKLDQLRSQDSPVRLFQLMEGDNKKEPAKQGKNW